MNEGIAQSSPEYVMSQAEEEAVMAIEEAGHDLGAIRAYRDNIGEQYTPLLEWEDWIDEFEESYQGEMSTEDFAAQLADEMMPMPTSTNRENEWLMRYFDYEKWERDLFMSDYWENDGFIFRSL